jgi:acetyl esterase/lipase
MQTIVDEVAEAIGLVYENISKHGGDPERLLIMGHSAGAQIAALICTDFRYLGRQSVPMSAIKLCVPVDGDTYDIPAMIETTEIRQKLHGLPLPDHGRRIKFGDDPALHRHFPAISHLSLGQPVPRFLILHVSGHPDVTAQASRFREAILKAGGVATSFAAHETTHSRINSELGSPEADTTHALVYILKELELPFE